MPCRAALVASTTGAGTSIEPAGRAGCAYSPGIRHELAALAPDPALHRHQDGHVAKYKKDEYAHGLQPSLNNPISFGDASHHSARPGGIRDHVAGGGAIKQGHEPLDTDFRPQPHHVRFRRSCRVRLDHHRAGLPHKAHYSTDPVKDPCKQLHHVTAMVGPSTIQARNTITLKEGLVVTGCVKSCPLLPSRAMLPTKNKANAGSVEPSPSSNGPPSLAPLESRTPFAAAHSKSPGRITGRAPAGRQQAGPMRLPPLLTYVHAAVVLSITNCCTVTFPLL